MVGAVNPVKFVSDQSTSVVWACGSCGMLHVDSEAQAEGCCLCSRCGGQRKPGRTLCEPCDKDRRNHEKRRRHSRLRSLPVVPYNGEPVYVDDIDRFFTDAAEAADWLWDTGRTAVDVVRLIVHPCRTRRVGTPDLRELVEDAWSEDSPDDSDYTVLSRHLTDALATVQALAESEAPEVWEPRLTERVVISPVFASDGT